MLEWLKTILGDAYTGEIDKQVSEEIGKGFVARADFNTLNDTKKQLEQDVKTRDTQIAELKKVDPGKLQEEIGRLQKQNESDKAAWEAQRTQDRIDAAVELALVNAKARNGKAVRALLELDKAELDGDGKTVKGLEKQIKKLREAEDSKFLFEAEGARFTGVKPGESFKGPDGKVDATKMTYEEMAAYMEANPGAVI